MSTLPPELAAWAEPLAAFAPELVGEMATLARRLDVLVGRVRVRPRPVGDDPEGYDGLDRRGPYDRLLLSEWALAEEVPEEFDRRASAGEHTFLRLDRRDRARGARTLLLFDAGPESLGGPRVVQLVALVVLARRALGAGAELVWGTLQGGALATTVDAATVQGFLAGRSGRTATAADVTRACAQAGNIDELWIIGGTELPRALPTKAPPTDGAPAPPTPAAAPPTGSAPTPLHLALVEIVAPDTRAVQVHLRRAGAALGEARLDLPPPALCVRALTDPFRREAPAHRAAPAPKPAAPPPEKSVTWEPFPRACKNPSSVRFLPGTAQLFVVVEGARVGRLVLSWRFSLDQLQAPKPKLEALPGEPIVALGRSKQRALVVSRTSDGSVRTWFASPLSPPPGVTAAPGDGHVVTVLETIAFTDAEERLFIIPAVHHGRLLVSSEPAAAVFRLHERLLAVVRRPDGPALVSIARTGEFATIGRLPGTATGVWLGSSPYAPDGSDVLLLQDADGALRAFRLEVGTNVSITLREIGVAAGRIGPDDRVLGVAWEASQARPITWNLRRNAIRRLGSDIVVTPARTPKSLTVSPSGTVVAWHTPEGFVEAWSLTTGAPLLLRYGT